MIALLNPNLRGMAQSKGSVIIIKVDGLAETSHFYLCGALVVTAFPEGPLLPELACQVEPDKHSRRSVTIRLPQVRSPGADTL